MRRTRSKRNSRPSLRPDLGDRAIEPPRPVLAAEFAHHVVRPRHAQPRHVRVQQEGPPGQVDQQIRPAAQRAQQAVGCRDSTTGRRDHARSRSSVGLSGGERMFTPAILAEPSMRVTFFPVFSSCFAIIRNDRIEAELIDEEIDHGPRPGRQIAARRVGGADGTRPAVPTRSAPGRKRARWRSRRPSARSA